MPRVLREPQDPEGNRGAKTPFDELRVGTTKHAKFGEDILTADYAD